MTRLTPAQYLDHIRSDSARFRDVLADCDPAARVPGCPDWNADDLLWHLTGVQAFWADVISTRPAPPIRSEEEIAAARPVDRSGLLAAFDAASARLVDALANADAAEPAWSWHDLEQTVGFTFRRQAHEALIHRLDAEQTAGDVTPLDAALATDGVAELVEVMYGGEPPAWGRFEQGEGQVRITLTDVGTSITVAPGLFFGTDPESGHNYDGPHLLVVEPAGEPAATLAGTAADVDALLWSRASADVVTWAGDTACRDRFLAAVSADLD